MSLALSRSEYDRFSPWVRRQAVVLAAQARGPVDVADLCASGYAGLIDGLEDAHAMRGSASHDDYVLHRIRGGMLDHLMALQPDAREARRTSARLSRAIRGLQEQLDRAPSSDEIAQLLGLGSTAYARMLEHLYAMGLARVEVPPPEQRSTRTRRSASAVRVTLTRALESVPPEARELLAMLGERGSSMQVAAERMGLSFARATALYTESVHRIRACLDED